MAAIVADQVKETLLKQQLLRPPWVGAQMGLFTANLVIDHATTLAAVVASELLTPGYARQPLLGWVAPTFTLDFHVLSFANTVTFNNTSAANTPNIWGWFFVDIVGNRLIAAGKYAPPKVIAALGTYRTTPFYQLTGE